MGEGRDLLFDEAAHDVAEGVVLGGVERALHCIRAFDDSLRVPPWPEHWRLTCAEWLGEAWHLAGPRPSNSTQDGFRPSQANSKSKKDCCTKLRLASQGHAGHGAQ